MKMKFGAIVVDGRGKIGGHVASKNRAGAYLRTKVTPVNPRTVAQAAVRSRLASLSIAWRGLTEAQRLAWNDAVTNYARTDIFGDLRNPSGINLFQKLNNNLLNVGETRIEMPPTPAAVGAILTLEVTAVSGGALTIEFTPTPGPTGNKLVVRATPAISPGKSFVKSEFRQVAVLDAAAASPNVTTTDYEAVFGAVGSADQKIFVEAFYVNAATGQAGVPLQASCIIT